MSNATRPAAPPEIHFLIDHFDVIVAAGAELLSCSYSAQSAAVGEAGERARVQGAGRSRFLADVARLEAIIVGRLVQARRWASEAGGADVNARSVVRLFLAATAEIGEQRATGQRPGLNVGNDPFVYMRSRALIARDAAGTSLLGRIDVTPAFAIWGRIPLGALMEVVSAARNALAMAYGLASARGEEETAEPTFDVLLAELRKAS
ncbi:MAG TPA: hypothetical protein PK264_14150 [Hyphomicrobiaceae bacterium]|nr:hypothetical protein [Hyphomicrobiaceae bacterium]